MKHLAWLTALLIACGGDGVSDSKKLSDLTAAEDKSLCEELAEINPERTVTCSGQAVTVGYSKTDCATAGEPTSDACTATAGDARACAEALAAQTMEQVCADASFPEACAKLFATGCGG